MTYGPRAAWVTAVRFFTMNPMNKIVSCLLATGIPALAAAHPGHADDSTFWSALRHVFTPDAEHFGGTVAVAVLAAAVLWKVTAAARKKKARPTASGPRSRT
jgi:hypothetical protein